MQILICAEEYQSACVPIHTQRVAGTQLKMGCQPPWNIIHCILSECKKGVSNFCRIWLLKKCLMMLDFEKRWLAPGWFQWLVLTVSSERGTVIVTDMHRAERNVTQTRLTPHHNKEPSYRFACLASVTNILSRRSQIRFQAALVWTLVNTLRKSTCKDFLSVRMNFQRTLFCQSYCYVEVWLWSGKHF